MTTKTCPVSVDKCNNRGQYHRNVQIYRKKEDNILFYPCGSLLPTTGNNSKIKYVTHNYEHHKWWAICRGSKNKPNKLPYNNNVYHIEGSIITLYPMLLVLFVTMQTMSKPTRLFIRQLHRN
jgi:hypothetical protein